MAIFIVYSGLRESTVSGKTILEVRDLVLELGGKRILDRLSLEVWEGHVHAVVGPNGAGKSTLASTIMGLSGYRSYRGEILFEGEPLDGLEIHQRARKGITLAWQEPARYEGVSVAAFIRASRRNGKRDIREVLRVVGLEPARYLDRSVDRTLSGGERMRIELASILAMEPRLVMLDEPVSGIDVDALNRIFDAITCLREQGATVLLITHSMEVLRHAEHAFLLCCGRLQDKGSAEKIGLYFGSRCIPCDHQNVPDELPGGGERK